jgi:hypothetical protein
MPSTPQAATLDQMSRTTGSNMIVRSAAGSFNEMDEHLTTDYSSKTGRYGWISRPTGLIHAVLSAYLLLTIMRELLEVSHKTCGGIRHQPTRKEAFLFGKLSDTNQWLFGTNPWSNFAN